MKKTALGMVLVLGLSVGLTTQSSAATVKLTSAQQAQIKYLVEEEKLARDVYTYLLGTSGSQKFRNIAQAEQTHMNLVSGVLKTYGVVDPSLDEKAGVFQNTALAALYKKLTASGRVDYVGALAAGVAIEKLDIADLKTDIKTETASDVLWMLNTLLQGSEKHLVAFTR